jgi:hypothetical protein
MLEIFLAIIIISFLILFGLLSIPLKQAARKQQNEKPRLKTTRLE